MDFSESWRSETAQTNAHLRIKEGSPARVLPFTQYSSRVFYWLTAWDNPPSVKI